MPSQVLFQMLVCSTRLCPPGVRAARQLGLPSQWPEQLFSTGPDNLWILAERLYGIFELKTGSQADNISKSYVDQLGGSVRWAYDTYGKEITAIPISVPTSRIPSHPAGRGRVITPGKLDQLKEAVRGFAVALADGLGRWKEGEAVAQELARLYLTGKTFVSTYTVGAKSQSAVPTIRPHLSVRSRDQATTVPAAQRDARPSSTHARAEGGRCGGHS